MRSDEHVTYGLLENIKDGYLVSSKYKSKALKIKTPNTVIVFSNNYPIVDSLSKDRWVVYEITCSGNLFKRANQEIPDLKFLKNCVNRSYSYGQGSTYTKEG